LDLTTGAANLSVTVTGEAGFDMHLFLGKDTFAVAGTAAYADTASGSAKVLSVPSVPAGRWYAGVKCATTVTSQKLTVGAESYYQYSGKREVLNGVAYSIKATWEATGIGRVNHTVTPDHFSVDYHGSDVFFRFPKGMQGRLKIYDLKGRLCRDAAVAQDVYTWKPTNSGMYIARLETGNNRMTKRLNFSR
ncbi:MAG: T9SS type A sorting domain-containing protein, partial [Chitinispirillaceae bacterium]|nr:T9SS type A sorting domain-containing protein [Chitinispirillaceae bacterium]